MRSHLPDTTGIGHLVLHGSLQSSLWAWMAFSSFWIFILMLSRTPCSRGTLDIIFVVFKVERSRWSDRFMLSSKSFRDDADTMKCCRCRFLKHLFYMFHMYQIKIPVSRVITCYICDGRWRSQRWRPLRRRSLQPTNRVILATFLIRLCRTKSGYCVECSTVIEDKKRYFKAKLDIFQTQSFVLKTN